MRLRANIYIFFIVMAVILAPMYGSSVFSAGVTDQEQLPHKTVTSDDINAAKSTYELTLEDSIWVTSVANKYKVTIQAVVALKDAGKDKNAISQLLELYAKGRSIVAGSASYDNQRSATPQICRIFGYPEEKANKWIEMGADNEDLLFLLYISTVFGLSLEDGYYEATEKKWSEVHSQIHQMAAGLGLIDGIVVTDEKEVPGKTGYLPLILPLGACIRLRKRCFCGVRRCITAMIIALFVFPSSAWAASIIDPSGLYDAKRVNPFLPYFQSTNETVSPLTGALSVTQTDLVLPGRQGLDLVVGRIYSSNRANEYIPEVDPDIEYWTDGYQAVEDGMPYYCDLAGSEPYFDHIDRCYWEDQHEHTIYQQEIDPDLWYNGYILASIIGEHYHYESWYDTYTGETTDYYIYIPENLYGIYCDSMPLNTRYVYNWYSYTEDIANTRWYTLGVGWSFSFPSLEIYKPDPNGIEEVRFLHLSNGMTYKANFAFDSGLDEYELKDMVFKSDTSYTSHSEMESAYSLTLKNGTCFYFGIDGRLLREEDRYGNVIMYYNNSETKSITHIVDSVGRRIDFTSNGDAITLALKDVDETQLAGSITYSMVENQHNGNRLQSVTDMAGRVTQFIYQEVEAKFSYSNDPTPPDMSYYNEASNYYVALQEIIHPIGDGNGKTKYIWETPLPTKTLTGEAAAAADWQEYIRIAERYDSISGDSTKYVNKTYQYYPNQYYSIVTTISEAGTAATKMEFTSDKDLLHRQTEYVDGSVWQIKENIHDSDGYPVMTKISYDNGLSWENQGKRQTTPTLKQILQ